MAKSVHIKIGGSSKELVRETDKAEKSLKTLDGTGKKASAGIKTLSKSFIGLGVAAAGAGAAIGAMTLSMAENAKEIKNLAAVAGVSTTEFQKMAFAVETVGIEQDKLSDILKDVNDRAGDLLTEKSGELAEFFKRLGVSADEAAKMIKGLSSRDTLQLMVKLMKEAGFNMQQMTSGMEMVASDATLLLPLLQDNGKAMNELGKEAEALGAVLSEQQLKELQEAAESINRLKASFKALGTELATNLAPIITEITDKWVGFMKETRAENQLEETNKQLRENGVAINLLTLELDDATTAVASMNEELGNVKSSSESIVLMQGLAEKEKEVESLTAKLEELTKLQKSLAGVEDQVESTDTEDTDEKNKEKEKGLEFSLAVRRIAWQNHFEEMKQKALDEQAQLTEIEEQAAEKRKWLAEQEMAFKFQAWSSAFGDLSSLMNTESKDLFEIGKAAALSETAISGFYSAQKAYEGGLRVSGGNPLVGAGFAAASATATAVQLAGIARTTFGSGGGSQPSVPQAAVPELQAPTKNVNISVDGDSVSKQQLGSIAEQLQAEIDDGAILTGITFS